MVEESVSGVRVIKGFGAEDVQAAKLRDEADDIQRVSLDAARIRSAFLPALDLLPNLGLIAVLGIGGHRVIDGEMTYGQMVEFLQYIALLIVPLRSIGMTVAFGQRAAAALMRVDEVLRTEPAVADPVAARTSCRTPRRSVRFASATSASATTRPHRCSTASTSTSPPASRSPSSAPPAAASPRSPACSPASTTSTTGASSSTASSCPR